VTDDVGGGLDGEVAERDRDAVDQLGGRVDDADAGHTELHPVVAGGLDVGVGQHCQQDVVDTIDLIVNEIDEQSSTDETCVQTHLSTRTNFDIANTSVRSL